MQASQDPTVKDLVLVGGGHSHIAVLKRFGMKPLRGVRLTLICRDVHTPYSGMLPGFIAGHYDFDQSHIDLGPLAQFAGARFIHDEVVGLDPENKTLQCARHPELTYDLLSINIGSAPRMGHLLGAHGQAIPVKPIGHFVSHWERLVHRAREAHRPFRIAVVGAGAGGVELTLAAQYRLQEELRQTGQSIDGVTFQLITSGDTILPTHNRRVQRRFERILRERGIRVETGKRVEKVKDHEIHCEDGSKLVVDEVLWVTAASPARWLADTGLKLDEAGFIQVADTLQSVSHPDVFAAGDIATMLHHPREKAGVMAVRQGKPLTRNLRRRLLGRSPKAFKPQKYWLSLISTGDRCAVASREHWPAFEGAWVWKWKDWIDRRFIATYNELPEMPEEKRSALPQGLADPEVLEKLSTIGMRCGGCGAKVGSTVLSRALSRLQPLQRDDILVGLNSPDDAAVVQVPPDKRMVHSVDFFRSFVDDPYIFGQVAANHSLGDLFAMGAEPQSALAIATVPYGLEQKVEETLFQMMAGGLKILNESNTSLAGGHSSEGAELAMGFSVNGLIDPSKVVAKGGMQPGDALLLTKPVGTGTLFAAAMRLKAKGRWIDGALESMVQSNRDAALCLQEHGVHACTDVTGFGLLGHLVEMIRPSDVDVELDLDALPVLDGAIETVRKGILSSLQPENIRLRRAIHNLEEKARHPAYPLLFDPQTAGGLLASLPEAQAEACLKELRDLGYPAVRIGRVNPPSDHYPWEPIRLTG